MPHVYYRLTQAGHVELVVEEVRLDAKASKCFQAKRRLFGGIRFGAGKAELDDPKAAAELDATVELWKAHSKQGAKPLLVLHGNADRVEVNEANAAQDLSRRRADAVKAQLVERGIPAEQLKVAPHGWHFSPQPLQPNEALLENRRVEIAPDSGSPSIAKLAETAAVGDPVLGELQKRIRALEGTSSPPELSLHAPRLVFEASDGSNKIELVFDVASAPPDAIALHRYFMNGLSNGCSFQAP